jgi:DNA-binding transcriptional MerR regulator
MVKLLPVDEAAEQLCISVCTLRYLRQEGRFAPATKVGRRSFE